MGWIGTTAKLIWDDLDNTLGKNTEERFVIIQNKLYQFSPLLHEFADLFSFTLSDVPGMRHFTYFIKIPPEHRLRLLSCRNQNGWSSDLKRIVKRMNQMKTKCCVTILKRILEFSCCISTCNEGEIIVKEEWGLKRLYLVLGSTKGVVHNIWIEYKTSVLREFLNHNQRKTWFG
jgi:hypothetical protein